MDWAHHLLRRFGVDLIRYPAGTSYGVELTGLAATLEVDVVVDVGAHNGDFASMLRARGFAGRIVSFEPVAASFAQLRRRAAGDDLWSVHELALGEVHETRVLRVANSPDLSSFLEPSTRGQTHFSELIAVSRSDPVEVVRLDEVFPELVRGERVLVKVDTQGWDLHVLRGAEGVMDSIVGIQLELAVNPYYDGVTGYLEALTFLRELGFEPVWFHPVTWDQGVLGEMDCLLRRHVHGRPVPAPVPKDPLPGQP